MLSDIGLITFFIWEMKKIWASNIGQETNLFWARHMAKIISNVESRMHINYHGISSQHLNW